MVEQYNKMLVGFFLLGFWLILPIPFMLLGLQGYTSSLPTTQENSLVSQTSLGVTVESTAQDTFFDKVGTFFSNIGRGVKVVFSVLGSYFNILFLHFPFSDVYPFLQYMAWFLQICTIVFILFAIRGD